MANILNASKTRSSYLDSFETTGWSGPRTGQSVGAQPESATRSDRKTSTYGGSLGRRSSSSGGETKSSQSATRTIRKGDAPGMPEMPTYNAPEMDKRALKAATQKLAAPGVRTLRETVQQAMGKNYENPNVRKMTLREALQGYGTGLESVMAGAGREARSNQMIEIDLAREAEMANFQQQTQAAMQSYQNAWADYLKGEETVTETVSGPATPEESEQFGGFSGKEMGGKTYYHTRDPFTGYLRPI